LSATGAVTRAGLAGRNAHPGAATSAGRSTDRRLNCHNRRRRRNRPSRRCLFHCRVCRRRSRYPKRPPPSAADSAAAAAPGAAAAAVAAVAAVPAVANAEAAAAPNNAVGRTTGVTRPAVGTFRGSGPVMGWERGERGAVGEVVGAGVERTRAPVGVRIAQAGPPSPPRPQSAPASHRGRSGYGRPSSAGGGCVGEAAAACSSAEQRLRPRLGRVAQRRWPPLPPQTPRDS